MPEQPTSPLARYEAFCREGVLAFQWDPVADRAVFHPRVVAPFSGATDLQWRHSGGVGTVYSVTWIHPRGEVPYNVALVDLEEGFRMMSRVDAPEVEIGMSVQVRFDDGVPVFEPR